MSKNSSTYYSNNSNIIIPNQFIFQKDNKKLNDKAIEECKKMYSKNCVKLNPYILNQLKKDQLNIYLNSIKTKDIPILNKILSKYFYFRYIELSKFDQSKTHCYKNNKNLETGKNNIGKKKLKTNEPKNMKEVENNQNIFKIIIGISRHLTLTDNLISLSLNSILISKDSSTYLAQGLLDNKTLQGFNLNYCSISFDSYEILFKGLLKHEAIEYLDISNNNFPDKYGEMVAIIISSQAQRRDQRIWAEGLRNQVPEINECSRGLISINLRGNKFGKYSAECITKSLSHDQYIRILDISENNLDNQSCKKFIHMMRKNNILLTVDLRENPGYDEIIYQRMILKMSKNIRYLYQQFQDGKYTDEEFENLKDFIDISFFDVEIPKEIVDFYNQNEKLEENSEENQGQNVGNLNVMNDIQERDEEEEDDGTIKSNKEANEMINTEEENKRLIKENMELKKQIQELKEKKKQLENNINKNGTTNIISTKKIDPNNLDENYSYIFDLINELNEVMNNIENLKKNKSKPPNKNLENIQKNQEDNSPNNKKEEKKNILIKENQQEYNDPKDNQKNSTSIQQQNQLQFDNRQQIEIKKSPKNDSEEPRNDIIEQEEVQTFKVQDEQNVMNSLEKEKGKLDENNIMEQHNLEEKEVEKEGEEGEGEDEEINFDDLTEEEKIAFLEQQEIIQKLKEEKAAKGEEFNIQEYLKMLENQANEEGEEGDDEMEENNETNKINKSF